MESSSKRVSGLLILGFITLLFAAEMADDAVIRDEVIRLCTSCHGLDFYITPRSEKAWELTVARMNNYEKSRSDGYTDEQVARVIKYMANRFGEDSTLDPKAHFEQASQPYSPPEQQVASGAGQAPAPATNVTVAAVAPPAKPVEREIPQAIREKLAHPGWKPSRAMKRLAELGGYAAVFFSCAMFMTGHARRRLGLRFRPVHVTCALGLFLGLATHAIIYLMQYGNPPVLWYWFGLVSFAVLVLAEVQGIIRKRFGPVFLRIHVTAGYLGLTLAILHWIWAWL